METLPQALMEDDDLIEALPDDIVEEFLRRLPPEDPASLVRASLVCKRWRRIVADRGFCRRICGGEHHHRTPGMLGFFGRGYGPTTEANSLLFTPTFSFRPRAAGVTGHWYAADARHGRVLLAGVGCPEEPSACCFAIWDPITVTGNQLQLPRLLRRHTADFTWKAVVLCASIPSPSSTSCVCDHRDCHRGPFLVVFVGTSPHEVYAYVYSSQAGAWSHTASSPREAADRSTLFYQNELCRSTVAGSAVYFRLQNNVRILKYDLSVQEISSVELPAVPDRWRWPQIILTTTKCGGLGVAIVDMPRIHLWSWEAGDPDGLFRWVLVEVIKLDTVDHSDLPPLFVVDIVHGLGAIVIWAHDGIGIFGVQSYRVTKLCDDNCASYSVPYMSYCIPALNAVFTGEGSSAGVPKCKKNKKRKRKKKKLNS